MGAACMADEGGAVCASTTVGGVSNVSSVLLQGFGRGHSQWPFNAAFSISFLYTMCADHTMDSLLMYLFSFGVYHILASLMHTIYQFIEL